MSASLLLAAMLLTAPAASEGDWPQWRGPNRDGKSAETGLFTKWPEGGPPLAWENLDIGIGYGAPSVVGDRVFILGGSANAPGSPEHALCLNLSDGKPVWKTPLKSSPGSFSAGWGGGPRSTPTYANGMIYCLGVTGDLVCLKADDGNEVWRKNLVKDFGGDIGQPTWGFSESVLVDGDNVICCPGKGTGMAALNAKTGETVWTCKEFKDFAQYSSVVPTDVGGVRVYIQQMSGSSLCVRAKDGKLMFALKDIGRRTAVIPSPVVADGYIFFTAGYGAGAVSYKLRAEGDEVKADKVGQYKSMQNHHGGVIQIGDYVYGHSNGGWTCLAFKKPQDEAVWNYGKFGKGSIAYADGHFICYEETGNVAVTKASPEGWKELGTFKLPKRSKTNRGNGAVWGHPVVAHGKLFLRDFDYLFCFDLKK